MPLWSCISVKPRLVFILLDWPHLFGVLSKASSIASYTKYRPATKRAKLSFLAIPLKKPVTKAVFSAIECDLRVPSSNISAKPVFRALTDSSTAAAYTRTAPRQFFL